MINQKDSFNKIYARKVAVSDMWPVTDDMWHMTHDTWHMTHDFYYNDYIFFLGGRGLDYLHWCFYPHTQRDSVSLERRIFIFGFGVWLP